MRVRIAHVELRNHSGLERLFDQAVDRHLAWIVGSGSPTDELVEAGKARDYHVWHPDLEDFEPVSFWLAVRNDLIDTDSWTDGGNRVRFDTTNEKLGEVELGDDDAIVSWTETERIKNVQVADKLAETDYDYTEILYTVEPLKN